MTSRESSLLKLKGPDGDNLYRITDGGNIVRTKPLSKATRRKVVERDRACIQCGAGSPFEVDHIIRYADGGTNLPENLQTLCLRCHKSKGGR
ncbi:HNH endonuclease signature motif containing protein [Arthrobacter sp. NPDC080073]|uniref:HNH endonuclease n=1 Tax=Arthrobacter sp. NPDC080073 TaxID=3155919 RepID=UPI003416AE98